MSKFEVKNRNCIHARALEYEGYIIRQQLKNTPHTHQILLIKDAIDIYNTASDLYIQQGRQKDADRCRNLATSFLE